MQIKKIQTKTQNGNKNITIASGPIIIENGQVLLVRTKNSNKFKFPGGVINDNESFIDTLKREAKEEINCEVKPYGEPIFYNIYKEADLLNIILVHYLSNITNSSPMPLSEVEEIKWFDTKNLAGDFEENVKPIIEEILSSREI